MGGGRPEIPPPSLGMYTIIKLRLEKKKFHLIQFILIDKNYDFIYFAYLKGQNIPEKELIGKFAKYIFTKLVYRKHISKSM